MIAVQSFDANWIWVPEVRSGIIRRLMDGLAWALMKGVASCDKPRVDARSLRSEDTLMGLPTIGKPIVLPCGVGTLRKEASK